MLQMAHNVVNLRQTRKRRAREQAEDAAQANRVRHGASKAERKAAAARLELEAARLDGHFLGQELLGQELLGQEPAAPPPAKSPRKR